MKIKNFSGEDILVHLAFIFSPFLFLKYGELNFTLFDLNLIILFFVFVMKRKHFKFDAHFMKFLFIVSIFLAFSSITLLLNISVDGFVSLLQFAFTFFIMFTVVYNFKASQIFQGLRAMSFVWSCFLIYNLSQIGNAKYYFLNRFTSFFANPGTFGVILAINFFVLFGEIFNENSILLTTINIFGVFSTIILLLGTGSRAGLMSIFLLLPFFLLFLFRKKNKVKMIFLIILIIILVFLLINYVEIKFERNAFLRLFSTENTSVRVSDYKLAFQVFGEKPFFGWGIQQSQYAMRKNGGFHRPHNFFIAYLVELGCIGLIILMILLFLFFKKSIKTLIKDKIYGNENLYIYLIICGSAFSSFLSQQVSTPFSYRFFWFFFALLFSVLNKKLLTRFFLNKVSKFE